MHSRNMVYVSQLIGFFPKADLLAGAQIISFRRQKNMFGQGRNEMIPRWKIVSHFTPFIFIVFACVVVTLFIYYYPLYAYGI